MIEEHTVHILHHWAEHSIEKLGLVLMVKHYGNDHKVSAYKDSVN